MRYDSSTGKINISLGEMVSIARRCVSPIPQRDEDEPHAVSVSKSRIRACFDNPEPCDIFFGFESGGYSFEMTVHADGAEGNRLIIGREILSSVQKPGKQEREQVMGEGYLAAYALAVTGGFDEIELVLGYFNTISGEFNSDSQRIGLKKLTRFFEKCTGALIKYARPEIHRVTVRLPSIAAMKFPYGKMRDGQQELIRSAYRTLSRGGMLFASAPTGTGKTVSAIYPALRALGDGRVDKIFYLTPKSTTAEAVADCISLIGERGGVVRCVILTSKEKSCIGMGACKSRRGLCKYWENNSLADAALDLFDQGKLIVGVNEIRETAAKYQVCPHELMLTYSELCDLVVCDFNHVFDPRAYIRRFFDDGGRFALLIDEAHNLVERSREMFSSEISEGDISLPQNSEIIDEHSPIKRISGEACRVFRETAIPYVKDELREDQDGEKYGAVALSSIPARFYTLFDELLSAAEVEYRHAMIQKDGMSDEKTKLLRDYYYKIREISRAVASFDECYKLFTFYEKGAIRVKFFCLNSAPMIRATVDKCHGAVLFSATLSPIDYYRAVLGGDRSDEVLEVKSPFDKSQLSVSIINTISTRLSERDDTTLAICRTIAATLAAKRGHYMIFSPSFHYSEMLSRAFRAKYPKIKIITQKQNMSREEREEFLTNFRREENSYLAAFCVMGGIYSEGLDLAGDSLIGAIVVGIGMPALSYEREMIAEYYEEKYEMGKAYAYLYPGMNRVFQAAGRVIRREDDRGVIVLIDDRFSDPIYKKSLPELWEDVRFISDAKRLKEVLDDFWQEKV